jgi:hypothetical protein
MVPLTVTVPVPESSQVALPIVHVPLELLRAFVQRIAAEATAAIVAPEFDIVWQVHGVCTVQVMTPVKDRKTPLDTQVKFPVAAMIHVRFDTLTTVMAAEMVMEPDTLMELPAIPSNVMFVLLAVNVRHSP